jgi:uncharacterized membrane protein (UPF0182 family)
VEYAIHGLDDPVFHRDIGFYLFTLPVLQQAVDLLLLLTLATIVGVVVVYTLRLGVDLRRLRNAPQLLRVHVFSLAGFLLLVLAARHVLANYQLAYSNRGVAFGASYTDVHAQRPANWALALAAFLIGALLVANGFVQRVRLLLGAVALYAGLYLVLGVLVPAAVQQTVVEPSELKRERPYIANNIEMTQAAYGLDAVDQRELTGQAPLTAADLDGNPVTIGNVRLWDYRVIRGTYQQLQSFVPYYVFLDVDVDRYVQDGQIEQVLLSARELDQNGLPANAQTWTNERLVYTHGYGVVVSLVGSVSAQGLPTFLVERIPPTGQGVYQLQRPEIYFGEADLGWVVVDTAQSEFSGLIDTDNPTTGQGYAGTGKGSVTLSNYLKKLVLAAELGDRNLLLSGNLTSDSRVLLHRNVVDRVSMIAPFLELDADPYLVIADGRLVWAIDAYTKSDLFPHASREGGINYLRNSVKVTVDAYDGTVELYAWDESDPILAAWRGAFPGTVLPRDAISDELMAHLRYPEDMFKVQREILSTYHVNDADTFYQGEERWKIPGDPNQTDSTQPPFYLSVQMPRDDSPRFSLTSVYLPNNRENLAAFLSVNSEATDTDPETGYGSLQILQLPTDSSVSGPSQVANKFETDPGVVDALLPFSRVETRILFGNLLTLPVGERLLYVQPVYTQRTGAEGTYPVLQFVIASFGDDVGFGGSLEEALRVALGESPPPIDPGDGGPPPTGTGTVAELLSQASAKYDEAQEALAQGDFAAYGEAIAEMNRLVEEALQQLAESGGGEPTVEETTPPPSE